MTAARELEEKAAGRNKIERRKDSADGNMYDLDEFIAAYGGTRDRPPEEWVSCAHTKFFFNT